jgi:hypothetical protein
MHPIIQLKKTTPLFLIASLIVSAGLLPKAPAVTPAPDGGYPGENTAEGSNALFSLTTGTHNTANGFQALFSNTAGTANTASGHNALTRNTTGIQNTGIGGGVLASNTTGSNNTANGSDALTSNTTGIYNTAVGFFSLRTNAIGTLNTGVGAGALLVNTANANTAIGAAALLVNTAGQQNTAIGTSALGSNTTGNSNVALGQLAGVNSTTGSNNVYIGTGMSGVAGESNACYIASIFGQTSVNGIPVLINSDNKLGTTTSSRRFKDDIRPMNKASEAILALKPVTFHYKKEIDPSGISQFGLVAEDVEKVDPDLVVRDKEGKSYSVRYDQVNAMLLNEFLKEHRKAQEQEAAITQLKKDLDATVAQLTARLDEQASQMQKMNAQLEASKPAPQVVLNN